MKIDKEVVKDIFATFAFIVIMSFVIAFVLFATKDPFYG